MTKESMFTLKLESDLHDDFMAEAAATHRPASQLVRDFMRDFVRSQRESRDHDVWFREQIEQGLCDARDPSIARIPNEEVVSNWHRQRVALLAKAGERPE